MQQRVFLGRMEEHVSRLRNMAMLRSHRARRIPGFEGARLCYGGGIGIVRTTVAINVAVVVRAMVLVARYIVIVVYRVLGRYLTTCDPWQWWEGVGKPRLPLVRSTLLALVAVQLVCCRYRQRERLAHGPLMRRSLAQAQGY